VTENETDYLTDQVNHLIDVMGPGRHAATQHTPQGGERRQPGAREERPQPRDPAPPASIGPEGAGGTPRPPCAPSGRGNVAGTKPRALHRAVALCPFGAQEGGLGYGG